MVWSIVGLVGPSWLKSLSESEGVSGEWKIRKDPRVRKEKFLPLHVEGRSGGDFVFGLKVFLSAATCFRLIYNVGYISMCYTKGNNCSTIGNSNHTQW